jgi:hypothetical protein
MYYAINKRPNQEESDALASSLPLIDTIRVGRNR